MTPQPSTQPGIPGCVRLGDTHLTGEQFDEILVRSADTPGTALAEAHLLTCEQCSAELASLRESFSLFREASSVYADRQLRLLPRWSIPVHSQALQPAYFAIAAILLVSLVPMQMLHRRSLLQQPTISAGIPADAANQARAVESDDALLEDINSEASASVPTPMQALADPAISTDTATPSVPTTDQRKD